MGELLAKIWCHVDVDNVGFLDCAKCCKLMQFFGPFAAEELEFMYNNFREAFSGTTLDWFDLPLFVHVLLSVDGFHASHAQLRKVVASLDIDNTTVWEKRFAKVQVAIHAILVAGAWDVADVVMPASENQAPEQSKDIL